MVARASWGLMTLLAVGVAGYSLVMVGVPGIRGEFVVGMFRDDPFAAPAHLLGGAIALLIGAVQFSQVVRARFLGWHRWAGRVYVAAVALGGFSALHMAVTTPGGWPAQFGFSGLGIAWLIATGMAWLRVRQGDLVRHRMWMVRSYALTLAAVSLRIYLPLALGNGVPFETVYPAIAWLCWVPNLLLAEWLVLPLMARKPAR